jgi:hypothetical protein
MEAQGMENQEIDQEVMESLGEPKEAEHENAGEGEAQDDVTHGVKKRLERQERKHKREMRELQSKFENLQNKFHSQRSESSHNDFEAPQDVDEHTRKIVNYALQYKDEERRRAQEAEQAQHVQRQYHNLSSHLDDMADKYHDFDDVVRHEGANFTPSMRDAALLLPRKGAGSAGEVLYKLGKNPEELQRISQLHPLDQAKEIVQLSHSLHRGDDIKSTPSEIKSLGQVKHNPSVNSGKGVSEKTPISEIRNRMKNNTWK